MALADLDAEMKKVFDRPKPYTLNAFYVKRATVRSQTAEIRARDSAGPKGTPGWKYLTPEIMGGTRRLKRFERALQAKFGTAFAEPGSGARLDQYGNISQGDITRILSALGAFQEHGYRANRKNLSRAQRKAQGADGNYKRPQYFIGYARNGGLQAIYQIIGPGQVVPVLVMPKKSPHYDVRFRYRETVERSIQANADNVLHEEMENANAIARAG